MPTVHTVLLHGLTGHLLTLTATLTDGPRPALDLIGRPRSDGCELRDRVRAALINSTPRSRGHSVEVHIDPAGSEPDAAAVAVAVLAATHQVSAKRLSGTAVLGELGQDGSLHPVPGILPAVQAARAHGLHRVIVPTAALAQAALVDDIDVLGATTLAEVAAWLAGDDTALRRPEAPTTPSSDDPLPPTRALTAPLSHAIEIAAAGGHHLLIEAPDSAATLAAARWLHHLLPDLTPAQQLEVAAIRSLIGLREDDPVLVSTPPMVTVHHSASTASLIGTALPGAISRAHHGLLVAPHLDQFPGAVLGTLRGAMLQRAVLLARGGHPLRYPAGFQLFATSTRTPGRRRSKLPPELLDAVDIRLATAAHSVTIRNPGTGEGDAVARSLAHARARVRTARLRAAARWRELSPPDHTGDVTNAAVPVDVLHSVPMPADVTAPVRRAREAGALSRHGFDAVLRMAWTAADLGGTDGPERHHVEQALLLRQAVTTHPSER
ncbi:ATP-binding protein [Saccharothrix variisporea]|uniref:Magnesium chelatase family protein n=1 Tax=Saccharothrix variisporea TaxID=543527 RepID=A0A495X643_9PSEU|nr:ATP-binding protein [Saccharothrix variisporea]RKT69367.1 magnesium chelatase family protein [Saccharothrix variisporea]